MPNVKGRVEALLVRSKALIEKGWCQHHEARDAAGQAVSETSPNAVRWCSVGALFNQLEALDLMDDDGVYFEACDCLYEARDKVVDDLVDWNDDDDRTQPEVIALFDKAIAINKERVYE